MELGGEDRQQGLHAVKQRESGEAGAEQGQIGAQEKGRAVLYLFGGHPATGLCGLFRHFLSVPFDAAPFRPPCLTDGTVKTAARIGQGPDHG